MTERGRVQQWLAVITVCQDGTDWDYDCFGLEQIVAVWAHAENLRGALDEPADKVMIVTFEAARADMDADDWSLYDQHYVELSPEFRPVKNPRSFTVTLHFDTDIELGELIASTEARLDAIYPNGDELRPIGIDAFWEDMTTTDD